MKTLVFADVHLAVGETGRSLLNDFVAFLRSIDPAEFDRVIIVGDLFDFWFEYRHAVFAGYFDVLRALADLHGQGVECHLICGNHDFWAGEFIERDLGVRVHADSFECRFGDRRVLLVHGDGLNPAGSRYRVYKRIARSRVAVAIFRLLHPDWAMAIASRVSRASRSRNAPNERLRLPEIAAIRQFARETIGAGRADVVIGAHTHQAAYELMESPGGRGLYINTGGWIDERAYWVWDGAEFTRYCGLLTERRRAPVLGPEEREGVPLGSVKVAREEPDEA